MTLKQRTRLSWASKRIPESYSYQALEYWEAGETAWEPMLVCYGIQLFKNGRQVGYVEKTTANYQRDDNRAEECLRISLLSRARRALWGNSLSMEEFPA